MQPHLDDGDVRIWCATHARPLRECVTDVRADGLPLFARPCSVGAHPARRVSVDEGALRRALAALHNEIGLLGPSQNGAPEAAIAAIEAALDAV
jgi:hypothetical protein